MQYIDWRYETSIEKTKHPYLTMMSLYLGAFVGMFGEMALNNTLPQLSAVFSVDTSLMQWMVIGHMLVIGLMLPFASLLMKWFPIRKLVLFALGVFAVGSIISGAATGFPILLLGRMVQGVGPGLILPIMFAMVLEVFPAEKIGAAMGTCSLIIMFAPAIGPTLAGFIIGALSFTNGFHFGLYFTLALVVVGLIIALTLPGKKRQR